MGTLGDPLWSPDLADQVGKHVLDSRAAETQEMWLCHTGV